MIRVDAQQPEKAYFYFHVLKVDISGIIIIFHLLRPLGISQTAKLWHCR